jgi:pentatricopeptide repeat protein
MDVAGVAPNALVLTSVIQACEDSGRYEEALDVFNRLRGIPDIPLASLALAARNLLYANPNLLRAVPQPLVAAVRATVDSGRAARAWVNNTVPTPGS